MNEAGQEVERKFLVDALPDDLCERSCQRIVQGYVTAGGEGNEVRLRRKGERYFLTVKSRGGLVRREGEIEIDRVRFEALWPFTEGRVVEKVRYRIEVQERTVELDVYGGALEGLLTVEVEFSSAAESASFAPPDWFGAEVSEDRRYRNESLALHGRP